MSRHAAATVLGLCLLAGCATEEWTYTRKDLTPARLDQDLETCRREARRPQWVAISRAGRLDQEAINQCMERKGYTSQRER